MTMQPLERRFSMITLAILVVAGLAIAAFAYFGMRDHMPGWAIVGAAAIIVFLAALAWHGYRPLADERLEAQLAASPDAHAVGAAIRGVQRLGTRESQDRRETLLGLTLALDSGGTARIDIAVEDALLARFASGERIQVLQHQQHPERVALDRTHTRTRVQ